jgi:hypothetical protein
VFGHTVIYFVTDPDKRTWLFITWVFTI